MMGIVLPETCWASDNICNKNHLFHPVGILFPHINDDSPSKSHQISKTLCIPEKYFWSDTAEIIVGELYVGEMDVV